MRNFEIILKFVFFCILFSYSAGDEEDITNICERREELIKCDDEIEINETIICDESSEIGITSSHNFSYCLLESNRTYPGNNNESEELKTNDSSSSHFYDYKEIVTTEVYFSNLHDDLFCMKCTSIGDSKCVREPGINGSCREDSSKHGCYTLVRDQIISRGCVSELSSEDFEFCKTLPNEEACMMCFEPFCNNHSWPQCYDCNSTNNRDCSMWMDPDKIPTYPCPHFSDMCLRKIDSSGSATVRSCVANKFVCPPDEERKFCETCLDPLCNGNIFPIDRQKCLQCNGTPNCLDVVTDDEAGRILAPCAEYKTDEKCFVYANESNMMIRGCISDESSYQRCREAGSFKCQTCRTSHGCNNTPLLVKSQISCHKCQSRNDDDPSCAWGQPLETAKKCLNKIFYHQQDSCLTFHQTKEQTIIRDCSSDFDGCISDRSSCRLCFADGCNRENFKWQFCIQCNSESDHFCRSNPFRLQSLKCPMPFQSYAMRGCYTRISETSIITRGCISDLNAMDFDECSHNDTGRCFLCHENDCNKIVVAGNVAAEIDSNCDMKNLIFLIMALHFFYFLNLQN